MKMILTECACVFDNAFDNMHITYITSNSNYIYVKYTGFCQNYKRLRIFSVDDHFYHFSYTVLN